MQLISRDQWGARPAKPGVTKRRLDVVTAVVVHETDTVAKPLVADEEAACRAIQTYHQDHNGWLDIGYHWLVGMTGNVYQGRPVDAVGAHCEGFNTPSLGVAFITDDGVSMEAGDSAVRVVQLVEWATFHRSLDVFAHREKTATHCPGDRIAGWVDAVRGAGGPLHKG